MKKAFLALSVSLLSFTGLVTSLPVAEAAPENDLCICQTGTFPRSQISFFKAGCQVWNQGESCGKKMIVSLNENLVNVLRAHPEAKSVKLGYVGHWSSAQETVYFLKNSVTPLVTKFDVTVDVDNSACLATNNPYIVINYLKTLGPVSSKINFRGNQAISTGLWDQSLPGKHNFWAAISGRTLEVEYPNCKEFENQSCFGLVQDRNHGICHDKAANQYVTLRCELVSTSIQGLGESSDMTGEQTQYIWKRVESFVDPREGLISQASLYL